MKEALKQRKLERMYKSCSNLKEEIKKKNFDKFEHTTKNKDTFDKTKRTKIKQIADNKDK